MVVFSFPFLCIGIAVVRCFLCTVFMFIHLFGHHMLLFLHCMIVFLPLFDMKYGMCFCFLHLIVVTMQLFGHRALRLSLFWTSCVAFLALYGCIHTLVWRLYVAFLALYLYICLAVVCFSRPVWLYSYTCVADVCVSRSVYGCIHTLVWLFYVFLALYSCIHTVAWRIYVAFHTLVVFP